MKKTKIIATLGPSTADKETLRSMFLSGLNICRLNFSHGTHQDHLHSISIIRELNQELHLNVGILADLQGPKIRTHTVENNAVFLKQDSIILVSTTERIGTADHISINYEQLPQDVNKGEKILLDDGKLMLEVLDTDNKTQFTARVLHGGILSSNKGVNFPNTAISMPCLTDKDRKDLDFALQQQVDWIGLSFVRHPSDVLELKKLIAHKGASAKVVAKIEKPEALSSIDSIIDASDALMVARGDLGVEVPYQNVPLIQKKIITKARQNAKPVIVATQMMESMITNLMPTRAEVNDVANAVLDGADAVMLSGETSVGKHPVEVIQTMSNIVKEIETFEGIYHKEEPPKAKNERFISDSICYNAAQLAQHTQADAVLTMSFSGYTAYKLASHRPKAKIYVFTSNKSILTQISLIWGVKGFFYDKQISTDHTIADIKQILKEKGLLEQGELVINIASIPLEELGKSNMIKLSRVD